MNGIQSPNGSNPLSADFWRDLPQSEGRYRQRRREQQVVAIEELPHRVLQDSALHQRLRIISQVETRALLDNGDEVRVHPAFPLGQERAETLETARYPENREKVPWAVEAGVRKRIEPIAGRICR